MRVIVGSNNPVKQAAVQDAFNKVWPDEVVRVECAAAPSGVADQPMSSDESIRGALARANFALRQHDADFGVGLEGGVQSIGTRWFSMGWAVVVDRNGRLGVGSSFQVPLPPAIVARLQRGDELGAVDDELFGMTNSKQQQGYFGLITNGRLTRTVGYRDAVIAALAPFLHLELFPLTPAPSTS
ncbi:MAG: NTPase [Parcubacteria group bacterium Gr01-1014_31]|nr:MAG: NTPase [Parcubacteria group bacterium Gr01-1014_31]